MRYTTDLKEVPVDPSTKLPRIGTRLRLFDKHGTVVGNSGCRLCIQFDDKEEGDIDKIRPFADLIEYMIHS